MILQISLMAGLIEDSWSDLHVCILSFAILHVMLPLENTTLHL